MNAKTVLNDRTKLKLLQRLEALYHSTHDLIFRDTRSECEVEILLDAMQAFKQGQLRGVVRPVMDASAVEDALRAFSMTVEVAPFMEETREYLLSRGVRYIGEMFYVVFDARSPRSQRTGSAIFNDLRRVYGLKRNLDPLAMGWKPPYWEKWFSAMLERPVLEVLGSYDTDCVDQRGERRRHQNHPAWSSFARRLHGRGVHFLGQFLQEERVAPSPRETSAWTPGKLLLKQRNFAVVNAPIWAAALIPPSWKPSEEVPAIWLEEQKKIEQEQAEWQAQREREHQEQATAQPPPLSDEEVREANLLRSVEELELSVRSANHLQNRNIRFIGQLVQYTEAELLSTHRDSRLGRKSLREIREILVYMGFSFGMVLPPDIKAKLDALVDAERTDDSGVRGSAELAPEEFEKMLLSPIEDLGLSERAANSLGRLRIRYIGQLVSYTGAELLKKQDSFWTARATLNEANGALSARGLSLGMTLSPDIQAKLDALVAGSQSDNTSAP